MAMSEEDRKGDNGARLPIGGMMNEKFDKEGLLTSFYSDDGDHYVEWRHSKELGYSTWVCVTHRKIYYRDCVPILDESESPVYEENYSN